MGLNPNFNPNAPHRMHITSSSDELQYYKRNKVARCEKGSDLLTKTVSNGKEAFVMLFRGEGWYLHELNNKNAVFAKRLK